jgi:protein CpxP
MKKLLLMGCMLLGITAVSYAQGGGGRPQMAPADQAAALKTSLALTDAQTAKITTILTAQAASMDSLTKAVPDRQTARPAQMALRTGYTAKIKAVLTPDQAAAYDKQMAARRGGGGGMGGGGGTPPPPTR